MSEQLVPARTGLISKDDAPVALAGVVITADVRGLCAKVTVAQRYINRETQPIEAVYVFPLDEGAAVCGFEALIDGTLVVGEVKEREQAFRMYDDAMEAGHGAYLLDEERPDVFQASVGNLPAGKEVLLKITYVTELDVDSGALRFVVPTTVSPRYAPGIDRVGVGRSDAESLNPPVAWDVPYGLALSVRIAMPGGATRVESPSHPISVATDDSAVIVSLAQQQAALDRDFVLNLSASALVVPRAWLERTDDGQHAVAVAFVPDLEATPSPAEVIFVIDRSGSMGGSSIDEVRNALQLCLRSMMAGCRFNIVGFGSTHESLFSESRPYDEASLAAASAYAASLRADLGGTEILPALQDVLTQKSSGLPRQVVGTHRRPGHEHGRGARARAIARGSHPDVLVRHWRRLQPPSCARHRTRRRRIGGVHRAWGAHRTESRAAVQPAAHACAHGCPDGLERLAGRRRAVAGAADLRRHAPGAVRICRQRPICRAASQRHGAIGPRQLRGPAGFRSRGPRSRSCRRWPRGRVSASSKRARRGSWRGARASPAREPAIRRGKSSTWPCATRSSRVRPRLSQSSAAKSRCTARCSCVACRSRSRTDGAVSRWWAAASRWQWRRPRWRCRQRPTTRRHRIWRRVRCLARWRRHRA